MDTRTGELRELAPGETLASVEEARALMEAERDVPTEVEVPPSFLPMSPAQRLAFIFGGDGRGKDRKAAHAGQKDKPRTKARRQRYERAAARARRRE